MAEESSENLKMGGSQAHPAQNGHAKPVLDPEAQPLNGHAGTGEPPDDWNQPKFSKKQAAFAGGIGAFLTLVLLIGNIYLAVPNSLPDPPDSSALPCPKSWVTNEDLCYFFSDTETNWTHSQSHCTSHGGSLVSVETPEEKDFIKKFIDQHWIHLRRETINQPWKRPDGSLFNHSFPVRGGGECAYVNGPLVSSTWCTNTRRWVCSKPASCETGCVTL